MSYDVIVVGAGPAGWTAAVEGARLGLDVMLVDRGRRVGGSFVHTGAIPSKILREVALTRRRAARRAGQIAAPGADPAQIAAWIREGIANHLPTQEQLLASWSVAFRNGSARFVSPNEVEISTDDSREVVGAEKIILATGSQPRRPPRFQFDGCLVCDADSILRMESVPETLVVIGGGFVGCELACTFAGLGTKVTLIDRRRRILKLLDGQIAQVLTDELEASGVQILLGMSVEEVRAEGSGKRWAATVHCEDGRQVTAERALVAMGRTPNTLPLDLAKAGVATDADGWIQVDGTFRTSAPHVYAVGDVIGGESLAGSSAYEGRLAMLHATGQVVHQVSDLPIVIYTIPEIAMVGLTEDSCRELRLAHVTGVARYSQVPRTHIMAAGDGLLKLVVRKEDRALIGAHVIGDEAGELVQVATLLLTRRGGLDELVEAPYAFPTLGQLYQLAAQDAIAKLRA